MRNDLEMILKERFPKLFRQTEMSPSQSCMAFGIGCDDGWFDLIWECSKELEDIHPDLQYAQIKEKFAVLTLYMDYVRDKQDNIDRDIYDRVNVILNKYRELSVTVCEHCGTTENVKVHTKGWLITLCDSCYAQWRKEGGKMLHSDYAEEEFLEAKRNQEK